MKQILVLGDSITFGHGCADRTYYWDYEQNKYVGDNKNFGPEASAYCWGSLIANDNVKVVNVSKSGNNNSTIAWQALTETAKSNFDYIFACFSYDHRSEFCHPVDNHIVSASPLHPPNLLLSLNSKWASAMDLYRECLYHDDMGVRQTQMAINAVANIANNINAKFYWSIPFVTQSLNDLHPTLLSSRIPSIIEHFKLWNNGGMVSNKESKYVAIDGHPNELAHYEYSEQIIKPIIGSN